MRNLLCYYKEGTLVFKYSDDSRHITMRYVFYTFKEAMQQFRKDYGLQHKHIKVKKLY